MKIVDLEILQCQAGWRQWSFLKIITDEGIIGYSDCSESFGSQQGINAVIRDLKPLVIGQNPMATEKIFWDCYRTLRQSAGGTSQKAIGAIENALLDIKGKYLNLPVYELLGGPFRQKIKVYWSHCGTTRARSWKFIDKNPLLSWQDVSDLGKEVVKRGYTALKTNIIFPGSPAEVLMQGFKGDSSGCDQNIAPRILSNIETLMGTFREAVGIETDIMLDLNFNFRMEGNIQVAKRLAPFNLTWLEIDTFDPEALKLIRQKASMPIASCENLFTLKGYQPFLIQHAADIVVIDIVWNGVAQSKKIAEMAESFDINVAPHSHYSPLGTLMAAHFCMAVPNIRMLELDVDDVAWADQVVTHPAQVENGYLSVSSRPGWGADIDEVFLREIAKESAVA